MAIYSAVPPSPDSPTATATHHPASHHQPTVSIASTVATLDIEAWTISALESLSVSPIARGTGAPLSIPIDDHSNPRATNDLNHAARTAARTPGAAEGITGITPPRRPPSRRDSQRKREALLKGKEGSRQRRRWENDRLMHVPNVQPPLPTDWEVHPTHPVRFVPYQLAQYWDKGLRQRVEERRDTIVLKRQGNRSMHRQGGGDMCVGRVPKELRATAKRSPAVKGWLRVLEEPVRKFLVGAKGDGREEQDREDDLDSGDEEIVFVGRNGSTAEGARAWKKARREVGDQPVETGMVLDSPGDDDESSAFKRWLTHSISDYYGLESRSLSVGTRKVVYIAIKQLSPRRGPPIATQLPRPLWELC